MQKILEKFMKKYWKNAKKNWKSQGNSSVQKSGNHAVTKTKGTFSMFFQCNKTTQIQRPCKQILILEGLS